MDYLLDSCALLFALGDPSQLTDRARSMIEDPANNLLVSSATAYEIAYKFHHGKLPGADHIVFDYRRHLDSLQATDLPISADDSLTAGLLAWSHRDPFDRLIVAQATNRTLPVITSDRALREYPAIRTMWQ